MKTIAFSKLSTEKIMEFFKRHFPESEGYLVNSVVFDKKDKCFVIGCEGVDDETKNRYSFTLFAYNESDDCYPIAWSCPAYDNDFWTGDEVQEEYPEFIHSLKNQIN